MDHSIILETLISETAHALKRNSANRDGLRGVVFLYLNRAYEAGLSADMICDLLGGLPDSVLNRANLTKDDEIAVMDAYSTLDPIIEQQHRSPAD